MEVFRGKVKFYSPTLIPMYALHAGTGVVGFWLIQRALGA